MPIEQAIAEAVQTAVQEALKDLRVPQSTPDELFSVERVAELAAVSSATIRRWVEHQDAPAARRRASPRAR